jgi:quercetin dioxygenase-like cupin family protein
MANLESLEALLPKQIWNGVTARMVEGDRITMAIVELDPGAVVPQHSHDNEQLGLVIEGDVTFTLGEEKKLLGPGGTWRILGDTPHEVVAGADGAIVIDVFSPPRSDWEAVEAGPARTARWPA